jgi:predicted dinucleotide-utilizing enzyme
MTRVGIAGSGYLARGLTAAIEAAPDMDVSCVLTRQDPASRTDFPRAELLTTSIDEIVDRSDLVVECSGDVRHATVVVDAVLTNPAVLPRSPRKPDRWAFSRWSTAT